MSTLVIDPHMLWISSYCFMQRLMPGPCYTRLCRHHRSTTVAQQTELECYGWRPLTPQVVESITGPSLCYSFENKINSTFLFTQDTWSAICSLTRWWPDDVLKSNASIGLKKLVTKWISPGKGRQYLLSCGGWWAWSYLTNCGYR